jgi:ribosomal protein S3
MTNKNENRIGLAEMIDNLRQELLKSQDMAGDSPIKFTVENIDLELKVQVEKANTGGGGIGVKFWVVNADMKGEQTDTNATEQTIKLSLKARDFNNLDEKGKPRHVETRG